MSKATVIYDADCGFCKWCLALLLSWDGGGAPGALRPLALGTAEADRRLADLSEAERNASWHLAIGDPPGASAANASGLPSEPSASRRFSAGAAFAPALRLLRGGSAPAAVFARFPGASERGYRWVAEHRGLLGRFVPGRRAAGRTG